MFGFLMSSSTTRLYRGRVRRLTSDNLYVLPHTRQSWETMTSVSAWIIICNNYDNDNNNRNNNNKKKNNNKNCNNHNNNKLIFTDNNIINSNTIYDIDDNDTNVVMIKRMTKKGVVMMMKMKMRMIMMNIA